MRAQTLSSKKVTSLLHYETVLLYDWFMISLLFLFSCSSEVTKTKTCGQYLVPIPKEEPIFCMMAFEATVSDSGQIFSQKGTLPAKNVSLIEAMAYCENMPVLDQDGQEHGYMKLATRKNWRDAGDGVLGEGGTLYPWGEVDDGRCILDSPRRPWRWKDRQLTGSAEECKSESGVYDQIGNLWEWVDLELKTDLDSWLVRMKELGFTTSIDEWTRGISFAEKDIPFIAVNSICISSQKVFQKDGSLHVKIQEPLTPYCKHYAHGYLLPRNLKNPQKGDILPIRGLMTDNPLEIKIVFVKERLNEPIGAKVGGSFYSGAGNTLETFWVGHIPDFDGSIGFRCEAEPFEY